ncbi:unnamed protein product [Citrullus colocynthis]|uniref:Uncharacterized protein n=1 Tax=Citrullus colocynthis TaxID=252529 RepID=A0ABP0YCH5_9ROSI
MDFPAVCNFARANLGIVEASGWRTGCIMVESSTHLRHDSSSSSLLVIARLEFLNRIQYEIGPIMSSCRAEQQRWMSAEICEC